MYLGWTFSTNFFLHSITDVEMRKLVRPQHTGNMEKWKSWFRQKYFGCMEKPRNRRNHNGIETKLCRNATLTEIRRKSVEIPSLFHHVLYVPSVVGPNWLFHLGHLGGDRVQKRFWSRKFILSMLNVGVFESQIRELQFYLAKPLSLKSPQNSGQNKTLVARFFSIKSGTKFFGLCLRVLLMKIKLPDNLNQS